MSSLQGHIVVGNLREICKNLYYEPEEHYSVNKQCYDKLVNFMKKYTDELRKILRFEDFVQVVWQIIDLKSGYVNEEGKVNWGPLVSRAVWDATGIAYNLPDHLLIGDNENPEDRGVLETKVAINFEELRYENLQDQASKLSIGSHKHVNRVTFVTEEKGEQVESSIDIGDSTVDVSMRITHKTPKQKKPNPYKRKPFKQRKRKNDVQVESNASDVTSSVSEEVVEESTSGTETVQAFPFDGTWYIVTRRPTISHSFDRCFLTFTLEKVRNA